MCRSREEEILESLKELRAAENLPEEQTGNDGQDILDWIESQGIYIRE